MVEPACGGVYLLGHKRRMLCFTVLMMTFVYEAAAQQSAGTVFVEAGLSFPYHPALDAPSAPPFAAPGGVTVGWLVGGGVFLSTRLSIDVEAWRTGVMRTSQAGRHNTSEVSTRQDRFVALGIQGRVGSAFRLEPVAGMVFVRNEGTFSSFSGDIRGYFPVTWTGGIMFGTDIRIGRGRLAVVPGVRFAFTGVPTGEECNLSRSGQPSCRDDVRRWEYHYPRWTVRPSAALRATF